MQQLTFDQFVDHLLLLLSQTLNLSKLDIIDELELQAENLREEVDLEEGHY